MEFSHQSVMLSECLNYLNIKPDGIYVDGTAGGGGHSLEIAKRLQSGRLVSIDVDPDAVEACKARLSDYPNAVVVLSNYKEIAYVLDTLDIEEIDGLLLDLGVSSYQLDSAERGFSYKEDAPLDMRMGKTTLTAEDIVNDYSVDAMARMLRNNAQEQYAYRIAQSIERYRSKKRITSTAELSDVINRSLPAAARRDGNPSRKAFQAIRIEVNSEFDNIKSGLEEGFARLRRGGRLVVITFHSLEDKLVKDKFREFGKGCICPDDFPVCVCGRKPRGKILTNKALLPSEEEQKNNRRSRSARLRAIEKL